jgi:hypothetical protein
MSKDRGRKGTRGLTGRLRDRKSETKELWEASMDKDG